MSDLPLASGLDDSGCSAPMPHPLYEAYPAGCGTRSIYRGHPAERPRRVRTRLSGSRGAIGQHAAPPRPHVPRADDGQEGPPPVGALLGQVALALLEIAAHPVVAHEVGNGDVPGVHEGVFSPRGRQKDADSRRTPWAMARLATGNWQRRWAKARAASRPSPSALPVAARPPPVALQLGAAIVFVAPSISAK